MRDFLENIFFYPIKFIGWVFYAFGSVLIGLSPFTLLFAILGSEDVSVLGAIGSVAFGIASFSLGVYINQLLPSYYKFIEVTGVFLRD
jgi:hypothetical protein